MSLQMYILKFDNVHFGNGTLSSSDFSFSVSRLFSALFLEALKVGKQEELLQLAQEKDFVLSDAFPILNETPFLPKPIGYPDFSKNDEQISREIRRKAKASKKLQYIPWNLMDQYLTGNADIDQITKMQKDMFSVQYVTKKGVDPYEVAVTSMNCLLYVIAPVNDLLNQLMNLLQYSGLGGERSSGYGRFSLSRRDLPSELAERLTVEKSGLSMLMSTSLPQEKELGVSLQNAKYLLKKESGFAYSESTGSLLRKQDLYKFVAGSTFKQTFAGEIIDIRPQDFSHPVWNYSKGLFYQLRNN